MVRSICKDPIALSRKAEPATAADLPIAQDLLDTLKAHEQACVGMAANMIGVNKAIIAVNMGLTNVAFFNPVITARHGEYAAEEGCLSLHGQRPCRRWQEIEITYQDMQFKTVKRKFSGWIAQIIQHEVDHTNGILI